MPFEYATIRGLYMEQANSDKPAELHQMCGKSNPPEPPDSSPQEDAARATFDPVQAALEIVDRDVRNQEALDERMGKIDAVMLTLADEVLRLRKYEQSDARIADLEARAETADYAVSQANCWQQQWTEMRDTMWKPAVDKIARVEARMTEARKHNLDRVYLGELEAALSEEP